MLIANTDWKDNYVFGNGSDVHGNSSSTLCLNKQDPHHLYLNQAQLATHAHIVAGMRRAMSGSIHVYVCMLAW